MTGQWGTKTTRPTVPDSGPFITNVANLGGASGLLFLESRADVGSGTSTPPHTGQDGAMTNLTWDNHTHSGPPYSGGLPVRSPARHTCAGPGPLTRPDGRLSASPSTRLTS